MTAKTDALCTHILKVEMRFKKKWGWERVVEKLLKLRISRKADLRGMFNENSYFARTFSVLNAIYFIRNRNPLI